MNLQKIMNVALLTGLKRKIGKVMEALGASGLMLPTLLPGFETDPVKAVKIFAIGVLVKYIGELHAKVRGE